MVGRQEDVASAGALAAVIQGCQPCPWTSLRVFLTKLEPHFLTCAVGWTLIRLISIHSSAEEEVMYPEASHRLSQPGMHACSVSRPSLCLASYRRSGKQSSAGSAAAWQLHGCLLLLLLPRLPVCAGPQAHGQRPCGPAAGSGRPPAPQGPALRGGTVRDHSSSATGPSSRRQGACEHVRAPAGRAPAVNPGPCQLKPSPTKPDGSSQHPKASFFVMPSPSPPRSWTA